MKEFEKTHGYTKKEPGSIRANLSRIRNMILALAIGALVGTQIYNPNKRTIEAIAGVGLLILLWNFSTLAALWAVIIMYPFPFAISWGSSNEVFMIIILLVVLLRVSTGENKILLDKKIRLPVILMALSYVFSLNNTDPGLMRLSLIAIFNFFSAAAFMILIISFVDTEEKLRRTVDMMMVSAALVIAFTILETIFPGRTIIPNWLYTRHPTKLIVKGLRMGGPFHDYELNAEFFTLSAFMIFLMFIRSKRTLFKALFGALLLIDLFMMFTTITRGAFFALIAGTGYLLFLSRKELNIVRISYIIIGFTLVLFIMEGIVANYTTSGSLFQRVLATTFDRGLVPTNRVLTWGGAIERGLEHPIFGNGAGWDFVSGLSKGYYPHSLYLYYFNITGLFGLATFVWLMYMIVKSTVPALRVSLTASSFPEAFLKILHVVIAVFLFDQIKIEYLRNTIYIYFIWLLFGLAIATHNIVMKQRKEKALEEAP